jgi:hypothetical protein
VIIDFHKVETVSFNTSLEFLILFFGFFFLAQGEEKQILPSETVFQSSVQSTSFPLFWRGHATLAAPHTVRRR